jgi:hypothetical protein
MIVRSFAARRMADSIGVDPRTEASSLASVETICTSGEGAKGMKKIEETA